MFANVVHMIFQTFLLAPEEWRSCLSHYVIIVVIFMVYSLFSFIHRATFWNLGIILYSISGYVNAIHAIFIDRQTGLLCGAIKYWSFAVRSGTVLWISQWCYIGGPISTTFLMRSIIFNSQDWPEKLRIDLGSCLSSGCIIGLILLS